MKIETDKTMEEPDGIRDINQDNGNKFEEIDDNKANIFPMRISRRTRIVPVTKYTAKTIAGRNQFCTHLTPSEPAEGERRASPGPYVGRGYAARDRANLPVKPNFP
ncbi:hypothetical protein TNCV_3932891 [Trichonephila clavipes]|nr:hypothetical protein TNCV_3932891 [Trichonephila clavipes]